MSLNFSAAHSSRVNKPGKRKSPLFKRTVSSPLKSSSTPSPRKQVTRAETFANDGDGPHVDVTNANLVKTLAPGQDLNEIHDVIKYIQSHMFEPIPEAGGFNSVRIAEILNFRKNLPPIVTIAHMHALTLSPTKLERQISGEAAAGRIRKFNTPGRGVGRSSISEGLCRTEDLEQLARQSTCLGSELAVKYVLFISDHTTSSSFSSTIFSSEELSNLMQAGLIVASQSTGTSSAWMQAPQLQSISATSIANASKEASGTLRAIGGEDAFLSSGGRSMQQIDKDLTSSNLTIERSSMAHDNMRLSLPGLGPYLKLVTAARTRFMTLLGKATNTTVPLYLLREKWDGGVLGDDASAKAKRYRGEFAGVLPARTRKWKQYSGLSFDWVLAECFGAGLVEIFDTKSVGFAVRAT